MNPFLFRRKSESEYVLVVYVNAVFKCVVLTRRKIKCKEKIPRKMKCKEKIPRKVWLVFVEAGYMQASL